MAETDIELSVGLVTKDAVQDAKELKKEIEKNFGKGKSSKGVSIDIQTKKAMQEVDDILDKINEVNENPITLDVKTEEFTKLEQDLENVNTKAQEFANTNKEVLESIQAEMSASQNVKQSITTDLNSRQDSVRRYEEELQKMVESEENIDNPERYQAIQAQLENAKQDVATLTSELEKADEAYTSISDNPIWQQYNEFEQQAADIATQMEQMSKEGKEYQVGGDPQKLAELNKQLDATNDKMRLIAIRQREMNGKGTGGGGGKGTGIAGMAMGAKGTLASFTKIGKVVKKVFLAVAAVTLGVRGIMGIINKIRGAIKEGFTSLMEGDKKLKKQVDDLKKSTAEIKANLAAAFLPIIEMAIPYIQKLLDWVNLLINKIAMFVAAIAGQNAYTKAIKATGDAAAGASKQLSKFDELNNITTSGSDWSTQQVPIDEKMLALAEKFKSIMAEIKDYMSKNMVEPFKEGFSEAVGDLNSKIGVIKENIKGIKDTYLEIVTDPEVQEAGARMTQSYSKALGAGSGLLVNAGVNIGEALTGGVDEFLDDNKDQIKEDLVNTYDLTSEDFDKISEILIAISKIVDQLGESESLVSAISNALTTLYNMSTMMQQVYLEIYGIFLDIFGPSITENVDKFKGLLESLFTTLDKLFELFKRASGDVKDAVFNILEAVRPLYEMLGSILADVVAGLIDAWTNTIAPILDESTQMFVEMWAEYIEPTLDEIVATVKDSVELATPLLKGLWDDVLKPIFDWIIASIVPILIPVCKALFTAILTGLKLVLVAIKTFATLIRDVVGFTKALFEGDATAAMEYLKSMLLGGMRAILDSILVVFNSFKDIFNNVQEIIRLLIEAIISAVDRGKEIVSSVVEHLTTVWNKINSTLKTIKANMKTFWLDIIKTAVNAINNFIGVIESGINSMLGKIDDTGIGKALNKFFGETMFTDITAAIHIPRVDVPAFAQGGVIPPSMGEFIARLGDNNKETEVVSPLSTMKQAFLEAMQQSGGVGGDINIELTVDGSTLARTVVKQNELYRRQTGRSLLTT